MGLPELGGGVRPLPVPGGAPPSPHTHGDACPPLLGGRQGEEEEEEAEGREEGDEGGGVEGEGGEKVKEVHDPGPP